MNDSLPTDRGDRGAILILTLLFTIVLALIIVALATYAATGLKTSAVTTDRTESNSVATAGLGWVMEELYHNRNNPEDPTKCGASGPLAIAVPPQVLPYGGASITVTCELLPYELENHPTVELVAIGTLSNGSSRTIEVVAQVPRVDTTVQIHSWVAD